MSPLRTEKEILKDVCGSISNQQGFAYHLGVLVQVAYKHSCAQRSEKFFHAIKKLERNTRKFVSLKLSKRAKRVLNDHDTACIAATTLTIFSEVLAKGYLILLESYKNCMECVSHSMAQLKIEHFISLHMLLIGICSNIRQHVKNLLDKIEEWYSEIAEHLGQYNVTLQTLPANIAENVKKEIKETTTLKLPSSLHKLFGESLNANNSLDQNRSFDGDQETLNLELHDMLAKLPGYSLNTSDSFLTHDITDGNNTDLGTVVNRSNLTSILLHNSNISSSHVSDGNILQTSQFNNSQLPTEKKVNDTPLDHATVCQLPLPPQSINLLHKRKAKDRLKIRKMQNTPLKYKRYHYNFFKLCKRRWLKSQPIQHTFFDYM